MRVLDKQGASERPPVESQIKAKIKAYLQKRGGLAVKIHGGLYQRDLPDILYIEQGMHFWFEIKRPDEGQLTPRQSRMLSTLRANGANAYVVTSVEDVERCLSEVLNDRFIP